MNSRPLNRRDFWQPLFRVLEPAAEQSFLQVRQRAMATWFEMFLPLGTPPSTVSAAFDEIHRVETRLSVFLPDSEVSQLNRRAADEEVVISRELFALLALARTLHDDTGGAYDITTKALSDAWGFSERRPRLPEPEEITAAQARCGLSRVHLDPERCSVRFLALGLAVDFGSIGKGYALDRAAGVLRARGVPFALLHGGYSSILALGAPPGQAGWTVGVPGDRTVQLADEALGTSSADFQGWTHEGRRLGHILDPRTGWPADALASVSVLAPSAAEADALATAFFVLGAEGAEAYCSARPRYRTLLPCREGPAS